MTTANRLKTATGAPRRTIASYSTYSLAVGGLFGALWGVLFQYADSGGKRDFVSAASIEADRYEVQVDEGAADEAMRVLGGISATR